MRKWISAVLSVVVILISGASADSVLQTGAVTGTLILDGALIKGPRETASMAGFINVSGNALVLSVGDHGYSVVLRVADKDPSFQQRFLSAVSFGGTLCGKYFGEASMGTLVQEIEEQACSSPGLTYWPECHIFSIVEVGNAIRSTQTDLANVPDSAADEAESRILVSVNSDSFSQCAIIEYGIRCTCDLTMKAPPESLSGSAGKDSEELMTFRCVRCQEFVGVYIAQRNAQGFVEADYETTREPLKKCTTCE